MPKALKPSQILRRTKVSQCRGTYNIEGTCKYCALGAIIHWLGWKGYEEEYGGDNGIGEFFPKLEKRGLDNTTQGQIIRLNDDSKKSFAEIADWLESKGL